MSTRTSHNNEAPLYYIAFTCDQWLYAPTLKGEERKTVNDVVSHFRGLGQERLTDRDVAKGQKRKAFESSFDAKPIYHPKFLLQKINYIHQNCVRGKWRLVEYWEDYKDSSARYVQNKLDGLNALSLW